MKYSSIAAVLLWHFTGITTAIPTVRSQKTPAFFLAGDSTTAAQNPAGGGWGVGFLKTLTNRAIGVDLGYDGDTTASFVEQGAWANVIDAVTRTKEYYDTYVTIQFGDNDQKNTSGVTLEQYADNLKNLSLQVRSAGGTPLLTTPLSRRNFNSSGLVIEDLAEQRNITITVAESIGVDYVDLNEASTNYLDSIGANLSATYNRVEGDYTHLNPSGSIVFGDMMAWLLTTTTSVGPSLSPYISPDPQVVDAIKKGQYIYPSA